MSNIPYNIPLLKRIIQTIEEINSFNCHSVLFGEIYFMPLNIEKAY